MNKQKKFPQLTSRFLITIALEGLAAALWLLLIPKEAGNAFFLGYSLKRLAVLALILAITALAGFFGLLLSKNGGWQEFLNDRKQREKISKIGIIGGFSLALACWSFLFFYHFFGFFEDIGVYVRLLPIVIYLLVIGLETMLFIAQYWLERVQTKPGFEFKTLLTKVFWISIIILVAGWVVIEVTDIGKFPDYVSIISLGVPLLEGQIWYVTGLIALILCLAGSWARIPQSARGKLKVDPDVLVFAAVWALSVVLWMSLPLPRHNYFAPQSLPPNYSIYPFSDAEQYDMNSLWVWKGSIKDTVISKPLYIVFLSILHALVGLDYGKVVLLQTLVLALLPAVIYLIGKELHSRLGGLVLALFVIFREMNSILTINTANVSNSKLLLSDMPAALLVCVLIWVMIRWFKSKDEKAVFPPFAAGGIIACLILMRIQSLILIPLFLFLIIIRYWKRIKKMLLAAGLLILALMLVLTPVLIRNHSITNVYWVDNPSNYALYQWLLRGSDIEVDVPTSGTAEEMMDANVEVVSTIISSNILGYSYHVADNFMRNTLSTLLILPVRLGNQISLIDYVQINDPFWSEVYSQANFLNALVVIFNLIMISIGIAAVARKNKAGLLLVILFYLVYSMSSAIVRLSGWRYILPVDWLVMAFFAFGIIECLRWITARFYGWNGFQNEDWLMEYQPRTALSSFSWKPVLACGLIFVGAGAFISIRESVFPVDYPDYTREEVCATIQNALTGSEWEDQSRDLAQFCMREDVLAYKGIGVYPRFFKEDTGFYKRTYDPFFGEQDYGRLVFRTVGDPNSKVYIKTDDDDIRFPDGTLVYVVGEEQKKFEARVVFIESDQPQIIVSNGDFTKED